MVLSHGTGSSASVPSRPPTAGGSVPEPFALANVSLVTADADGTVLPDHTVVVGASGKIEQVGPTADTPAPPGYRLMDMRGQFLAPGLINAHAHLFSTGRPLPPSSSRSPRRRSSQSWDAARSGVVCSRSERR